MLNFKLLFGIAAVGLASLGLCGSFPSLLCSGVCSASAQESQPKRTNQTVMSESPIACNLTALSKEQRKQHQMLTKELRDLVQGIRELPDGYSLRLSADESIIQ